VADSRIQLRDTSKYAAKHDKHDGGLNAPFDRHGGHAPRLHVEQDITFDSFSAPSMCVERRIINVTAALRGLDIASELTASSQAST
jgi:hypothetical protein